MHMKVFCFLLVFLASCFSSAFASEYDDLPISFRQKWEALLHYSHGKSTIESSSSFFLDRFGSTSPEKELVATIDYFGKNPKNHCRYPARYYLLTGNQPEQVCDEFNEYQRYVVADRVSLVFASESDTSPVSSMGHSFLVLGGINRLGLYKHHATAFVADSALNENLFIAFLKDKIIGRYTLNPYDDVIFNYLNNEQRSLWEYELVLTEEERRWLLLHLYELKEHKVKYSFFTHNCSSGINRILSVASEDFEYKNDQFYVTPIEYTKFVSSTGRIIEATVRPSLEDEERFKEGVVINPLNTGKTSKVNLSYLYDNRLKSGVGFLFLPFSFDLKEDSTAKSSLSEMKFFEVEAQLFKNEFIVKKITLVNLYSLANIQISSPKVNFGIDFQGAVDTEHTSLYPDLHFGTGLSWGESGVRPFYSADVGLYCVPGRTTAYLKNILGIFYTSERLGRASLSFEKVFSTDVDYRNYSSAYSVSYSKRIGSDTWVNVQGFVYKTSEAGNRKQLTVGFDYRF